MRIERSGRSPQNPPVSHETSPKIETANLAEKGLQIWGDVKFRADAVIQATVKGSVIGSEKVIVTEGTIVTGRVDGSDVRIEGEAQGGVEARGHVWLGSKAKVKVRCRGKAVRIEPGAEFRGELQVG